MGTAVSAAECLESGIRSNSISFSGCSFRPHAMQATEFVQQQQLQSKVAVSKTGAAGRGGSSVSF